MNTARQELSSDDLDLEIANILSAKWSDEDEVEEESELVAVEAQEFDEDSALIDVVDDLETAEELAESYNEQSDALIEADLEAAAPSTDAGIKAPKVKRARASVAGMKPSDVVRAKSPNYRESLIARPEWATMDDDARNAQVDALVNLFDAMPKKVGEKAVNVTQHLTSGATLSVYTKIAVDFLAEKGEVTLKEMIAHFETGNRRPYSHGTASAQSSQMMALLPAIGVALRNGSTLTYVADSPIAQWIVNGSAAGYSAAA